MIAKKQFLEENNTCSKQGLFKKWFSNLGSIQDENRTCFLNMHDHITMCFYSKARTGQLKSLENLIFYTTCATERQCKVAACIIELMLSDWIKKNVHRVMFEIFSFLSTLRKDPKCYQKMYICQEIIVQSQDLSTSCMHWYIKIKGINGILVNLLRQHDFKSKEVIK